MRSIRIFRVVAMILLISTLGVKVALAAEQKSDLTLDAGFVGRPVALDLFGNSVRVGWDTGSLVQPTNLSVSESSDEILTVQISDITSFASGTLIHLGVASTITDHPALHVVKTDGSVVSYQATKQGNLIVADVPVSSTLVASAVSDPNAISAIPSDVTALTPGNEQTVLTLDAGFVNRPVSLDLFGGDITVAWDAKTLLKPTTLTVRSMNGGTWNDQASAADGVSLLFSDASAVSSAGVFSIKHRALRPPTASEHPSVNIFSDTTSTQQAAFSGTTIKYTHAASSNIAFAPVFCSGIMRSGSATWYRYKGCLCAASPDVPKGTKLKVSRQDDPTKSVIITVNDFGPDRTLFPNRVIDLDRVAFAAIANPRGGVVNVTVDKVE